MIVGAVAVAAVPATIVPAQTIPAEPGQTTLTDSEGREWRFDLTGGAEYQLETDIQNEGEFKVWRFGGALNVGTELNPDLRATFRAGYLFEQYDFDRRVVLNGDPPWTDIQTYTFAAIFEYDASDQWTIFGGPVAQFSHESGGEFDDGLTAGGLLGATYHFSRNFSIGGGFLAMSQIEDDPRGFPIFVINWEFLDDWSVAAKAVASPSGLNGIELIYDIGGGWDAAVGLAQQYKRFRLDDHGRAPGGVGQDEAMPFWFRLGYAMNPSFRMDFMAGLNMDGELRLEDDDGDRIATNDYDDAPFFAFTLNLRF